MLPGRSLHDAALACLLELDPQRKCDLTTQCLSDLQAGRLRVGAGDPPRSLPEPGRPARPQLVPPRELAQRRLGSTEGRAVLVHAVAHIEFNAINLAWDAVYRFRDLPPAYYADWASVAADEARHFLLLQDRLHALGYQYGDFPAHNGLWEMALATEDDHMARMALVPRVLEARGLDVTPGMIERLRSAGDQDTVAALEVILREEVRHVEIGTRWFHHACRQRGLEPEITFERLLTERFRGRVRGPFNHAARRAAGFSERELARLEAIDAGDGQC